MPTSPIPYFDPKGPLDIAPFSLDFSNWLTPASQDGSIPADTITGTPIIQISGDDQNLTASTATVNGAVVTTVLSGGTVGKTYTITYEITTALGITVGRSAMVQVKVR